MTLGSGLRHKGMENMHVPQIYNFFRYLCSWPCSIRYKYVIDTAAENKKSGAYTQEIETIIHRKAHAIINCYLNSPVPPKVQVECDVYVLML